MGDSRTGRLLPGVLIGVGGAVLAAVEPRLPAPPGGAAYAPGSGAVLAAVEPRLPAPGQEARSTPPPAAGQAPGGRRDPFAGPAVSEARGPAAERPAGLAGLAVDEAVLRGVVTSRGRRLAVLEGPDGRTWVVRPADELYDGTVEAIAADALVLRRAAADSGAARTVRKSLRGTERAR